LAQHDAGVRAVEEWRGLKRGLLRIGTGPTLGSYILPPMLKRFWQAHRSVDLAVETGNSVSLIDSLRSGKLDLALLVASQTPEEPDLKIEMSWSVEYVLVTKLAAAPARCSIAALQEFPFIQFHKASRLESLVGGYFAETQFQPTVVMTFDNPEAVKAMIRIGFGIAMLPYWLVDGDLRNSALRLIRQKERPLISRIDLITRRRGYVPALTAAFAEMAREYKPRIPKLSSGRVDPAKRL
jgi:DNA-binding transcriptional LysR family regulator